jgi:hypothetical protein
MGGKMLYIRKTASMIALVAVTSMAPTNADAGCCCSNPGKTLEQVARDTGKTVGKAGVDVVRAGETAVKQTGQAVDTRGQSGRRAGHKRLQRARHWRCQHVP